MVRAGDIREYVVGFKLLKHIFVIGPFVENHYSVDKKKVVKRIENKTCQVSQIALYKVLRLPYAKC